MTTAIAQSAAEFDYEFDHPKVTFMFAKTCFWRAFLIAPGLMVWFRKPVLYPTELRAPANYLLTTVNGFRLQQRDMTSTELATRKGIRLLPSARWHSLCALGVLGAILQGGPNFLDEFLPVDWL